MGAYVNEVKSYIDRLGIMSVEFLKEQVIDFVLYSLQDSYSQFIMNFHIRILDVTLMEGFELLGAIEAHVTKGATQSCSKSY